MFGSLIIFSLRLEIFSAYPVSREIVIVKKLHPPNIVIVSGKAQKMGSFLLMRIKTAQQAETNT